MDDHGVLKRMQEMCEESCNPDQFERFMELKEYLLNTRGSLKKTSLMGKIYKYFYECAKDNLGFKNKDKSV